MMQIDVVTQLLVVFHVAVKCSADAGKGSEILRR